MVTTITTIFEIEQQNKTNFKLEKLEDSFGYSI